MQEEFTVTNTRCLPRTFALRPLTPALIAALCSGTGHAQSAADGPPAVTPYRPSVSTPAALSAPGWLEIEGGALRARGSGDTRRDSLPYTLKLAFTPDWGVRLGGDAWVRQTDDTGQRISGAGDARTQIASVNASIEALRDFWISQADLDMALIGKPSLTAAAGPAMAAGAVGAGH